MNEKELEKILKALANGRRLAILAYVKKHKEATVGDIAGNLKLSFKSTSRHLSVLYAANILEREQRSLYMHYKLSSALHSIAKHISKALE